jgi:TolB-like protein/Tfp pilus assembly protein PilF
MLFVKELRRRNVLRMAVLYAVAAWLIVQVAGVLSDLAKLPDWIGTTTLWLLAVGFPIALIFSWFYEITPEGISLEKDVDPDVSITQFTGRRLDFIVISLLCAAVILFAYDKWWMQGPLESSIAVLPFENMSSDSEQEYFSDGISEELLNLLAQIPELRVISRTSAFSFRGQNLGIREIARRLNVSYVLEGSVRRFGNKLRITAQLIQADDGFHLWSNSYDRDVDDIFAVQDEIAAAIGDALKLKLALNDAASDSAIVSAASPGASGQDHQGRDVLAEVPTDSPEAHIAYLKGRYYLNTRSAYGLRKAKEQFEYAIDLDPEYAMAYSGLADSYLLLVGYGVIPSSEGRPKQSVAAYKALALDENSAEVHASVGTLLMMDEWNWQAALKEFRRAIEINPNYGQALQWYGSALAMVGDPEHLAVLERAHLVDPVSLRVNVDYGLAYYYTEDYESAIRQLQNALQLDPDFLPAYGPLGLALVEIGQYKDAVAAIEKGAGGSLSRWLGYAHAKAGNNDDAHALLDKWHERWEESGSGAVAIALIHVGLGQNDLAFDWLNKAVDQKGAGILTLQSYAYWSPLRSDPRYTALLRRLKFID